MLTREPKPDRLSLAEIGRLLKPIPLSPLLDNPLVSILTANYNYAHFIGEAIESAQAQTYMNWEMIVCDDGSTDNSCEVVEHYMQTDSRIRLIKKQNGGQVSATNAAYCECKGQIVCFLDADDRYLPEKLQMVVQEFRSHKDCGWLGHRVFLIDASGSRFGITPSVNDPPSGWCGPFIVRYGSIPGGMAFGSGLCLRREVIERVFPISEEFTLGPDLAIVGLAPLMSPAIGVPFPLGERRSHGENCAGHVRLSSRRHGSEPDDRAKHLNLILMESLGAASEASRGYLEKMDPRLAEALPPRDETLGAILSNYRETLLQSRLRALSPYRDVLRAEDFQALRPTFQWFWRLSIIMPRPVLHFVWDSQFLRAWFWKADEVRRRYFAA